MKISGRELEVLQLIAAECTTSEIADQLYISTHTVTTHRKNLMEKLKARNVVGIIVKAIRSKLIEV